MQNITVGLGDRSYPISIAQHPDVAAALKAALSPKTSDLMLVSNTTVAPLYAQGVQKALESVGYRVKQCILKDGEVYKTFESWIEILTALLEAGFGRDGAIVALGGGVVGDMAGFAAACFQRGIDFVQLPTTLLAMVDSSVGGKTAVNHPLGKNMVGSFHQPKAVVADIATLKTLPKRELSAGMAEVIKTAVIYDEKFFEYLESYAEQVFLHDEAVLSEVVARCCKVKAEVVSKDEHEHGLRAILNFGHTFGHAVEAHLGFGTWLHGEAVALGMVIAAQIAVSLGCFKQDEALRLKALLERCHLPCEIPPQMSASDFITHMRHDKKVRSGKIRYVLPEAIGKVKVVSDLEDDRVSDLIAAIQLRRD